MIGPMEKGIEAAKLGKPAEGVYDGVDLRILPKYICFRAALLRQKVLLQHVILIITVLFVAHYFTSRYEITSLHQKLRAKEYILAPGVHDFTAASAQSVPERYVSNAVTEFISLLGNVAPGTIEEHYKALMDNMSPQLKIKFEAEATSWERKVRSENISQLIEVRNKEIIQNSEGYYKATAIVRKKTYIDNEYAGHADEVIEMILTLVPPKIGKRWYLEIVSLVRGPVDNFKARKSFNAGR